MLRRRLQIEKIAGDAEAVVAHALDSSLTAYDATYLWVAREPDVELVTLDRKLAPAAARN